MYSWSHLLGGVFRVSELAATGAFITEAAADQPRNNGVLRTLARLMRSRVAPVRVSASAILVGLVVHGSPAQAVGLSGVFFLATSSEVRSTPNKKNQHFLLWLNELVAFFVGVDEDRDAILLRSVSGKGPVPHAQCRKMDRRRDPA